MEWTGGSVVYPYIFSIIEECGGEAAAARGEVGPGNPEVGGLAAGHVSTVTGGVESHLEGVSWIVSEPAVDHIAITGGVWRAADGSPGGAAISGVVDRGVTTDECIDGEGLVDAHPRLTLAPEPVSISLPQVILRRGAKRLATEAPGGREGLFTCTLPELTRVDMEIPLSPAGFRESKLSEY